MNIAGNTMHSGDKKKDHRGYAETMASEQVDSLLSEAWLKEQKQQIRAGNEKLKTKLPFLCPHYSQFRNNHRAQADIIPESFTFMTCVDVDDLELVEKAIKNALEVNSEDGDWKDMVLRIDYSARKKVHIWILLPVGKTIAEAQKDFCQEIDVPYDESCITPERFIYLTDIEEEIYRSPRWMKPMSQEEIDERREAYLLRGLDVDGRSLPQAPPKGGEQGQRSKAEITQKEPEPLCNSAEEASKQSLAAFDLCAEQAGLNPTAMDVWGEHNWHSNLMAVLSVGVGKLMTRQQLQAVVAVRLPNYAQTEDCQKLIDYFYEKYDTDKGFMNAGLRKINAQVQKVKNEIDCSDPLPPNLGGSAEATGLSALFAAKLPPALPTKLPKLVAVATKSTPEKYKATVAQAIFPPLATYPKKLGFVYIDNQVRELRINCLIVAGTGAGKDSCTQQPLTHIIADMKERDDMNRERLKKFNDEYNNKAGNKQKPQRPDDLIIQTIKSNITQAALVQRMDEANGAPLYVRLNELEQWDKIEGQKGRTNQFTTLKLCDDEGNDFGADRAGTQSVMASGCLHLNWNANTTTAKVLNYFRYVLTDGPISRLCLATIPDEEIGADIPIFGDYGSEYDEALKPYIMNLKNATGIVDCPQARRLARKLKDECAEFARLSQDRIFDNLSHRALVAVFRKACLLYVANGKKWEKAIEEFCRWSLFYDLYLKLKLWGDAIRQADSEVTTSKRGPQSLLDLLPNEFTVEDVRRIRQQRGMDSSVKETNHLIRTWKNRGYCAQSTEHSFKKAPKFESKTI